MHSHASHARFLFFDCSWATQTKEDIQSRHRLWSLRRIHTQFRTSSRTFATYLVIRDGIHTHTFATNTRKRSHSRTSTRMWMKSLYPPMRRGCAIFVRPWHMYRCTSIHLHRSQSTYCVPPCVCVLAIEKTPISRMRVCAGRASGNVAFVISRHLLCTPAHPPTTTSIGHHHARRHVGGMHSTLHSHPSSKTCI